MQVEAAQRRERAALNKEAIYVYELSLSKAACVFQLQLNWV